MNSRVDYLKPFLANRLPPQLVIQFTNRCNARCPQCGMRVSAKFSRSSLSRQTLMRTLDAAAAKGVRVLSFTGGEPLLHLDLLVELIDYAGSIGIPLVRTGTNGFLFRHSHKPDFENRINRLAQRLAATCLRNFWISLDSVDVEVHEQMRGLDGVVAGIEKALPIFHAHGLYPSANLGINRQLAGAATQNLRADRFVSPEAYLTAFYECFCDAFDRFYRFTRHLGFTTVNACYPMSISAREQSSGLNAVYAASATEDVVRFSDSEKAMLYKALIDTIPKHRRHIRIFSPLSSLYMLGQQYSKPDIKPDAFGCRGGVDFFFISAEDGNTYPCGFRGNENLGKFWRLDLNSLAPNGECHRCDWECFRDPSELCAPLLQSIHHPVRLSRRLYRNPTYLKHWLQDIRYYKACDWFNGREPLNTRQIECF
jgi:MoaA/NifB/PqqE/SkfB family radical SAM enzyme